MNDGESILDLDFGESQSACRVYWGSHGCDLPRGHEKIGLPHVCLSCFDPEDMDGYVGTPPYYGPETRFYGEDAERLGLPTLAPRPATPPESLTTFDKAVKRLMAWYDPDGIREMVDHAWAREMADRSASRRPGLHRPKFYRYEVGRPAPFRPGLNRYGWKVIGVYLVVGRWAYCVKWAWARAKAWRT